MKADASMASHSLITKWVLHSMAHDWARDIPPMYSMAISPILPITRSWTKRCMAVLLFVWNNRQLSSLYNPMQKKGITLSINLSRIWWVTHSHLRTMMIGRKRLGNVNFAGKAKSISDGGKDR